MIGEDSSGDEFHVSIISDFELNALQENYVGLRTATIRRLAQFACLVHNLAART